MGPSQTPFLSTALFIVRTAERLTMYQRSCEGCGRRFEAQKASRRWCSDTCGRRTRRRNARSPHVVSSPVAPSDPYVRLNSDFARALGASVPAPLLSVLASDDDDYRDDSTEQEFWAVALRIALRLQDAAQHSDWDGYERLARSSVIFADDLVDTRVVSYLAKNV
jgi:hypothetical protein